jgi:hypothetical protein
MLHDDFYLPTCLSIFLFLFFFFCAFGVSSERRLYILLSYIYIPYLTLPYSYYFTTWYMAFIYILGNDIGTRVEGGGREEGRRGEERGEMEWVERRRRRRKGEKGGMDQ